MLTDAALRRLKSEVRTKQQVISDRDGLYISVSPKGKITFFMRYRIGGKPDRMSIGGYPAISLKEAREINLKYRGELDKGRDPKSVKKLESYDLNDQTFSQLTDAWYEKESKVKQANHKANLLSIKKHAIPRFGDLKASDISTHAWLDFLETLAESVPGTTRILLSNIKLIYSFGVRRRLTDSNPLSDITAYRDLNIKIEPGERSLNDDEIYSILNFCENSSTKKHRQKSLLIKLALIYGCRMSELANAVIDDFDFKAKKWTTTKHKTAKKSGKPIVRPIIDETEILIKELLDLSLTGSYLVENKFGEQYDVVFWARWPGVINAWLEKKGLNKIEKWTIHALRKTMRTNMSSLAQPHICEIMLGHSLGSMLGGTHATYDKYEYLEEQAAALNSWCERLDRIRHPQENVHELRFS